MTSTVVYPDANPETTSVDGWVGRNSVDQTFTNLRAGAGTIATDNDTEIPVQTVASTTTDQFQNMLRGIVLFDTSSIPDADVISAATLGLNLSSKLTDLGDTDIQVVASTPASNTALANSDYGNLGSTTFGATGNISGLTLDVYTDVSLNASGISAISKTGVSKFGLRLGWDYSGTFGGTWVSEAVTQGTPRSAEAVAGTTQDPKLTVTHAASTFVPRSVTIT